MGYIENCVCILYVAWYNIAYVSKSIKETAILTMSICHTPSLERASSSFNMSGQCWGHSRLIISTTMRERTSLMWLSSSKIFWVPCEEKIRKVSMWIIVILNYLLCIHCSKSMLYRHNPGQKQNKNWNHMNKPATAWETPWIKAFINFTVWSLKEICISGWVTQFASGH